jgi:hypothetical protein
MGLPDYGKAGKVPPRDPRFDKQTAPARSLNEGWLDALERCAADTPLNEVIFPLMRICFFYGAMHAVFLLDDGHGDQLAADIAGFLREEPRS